MYPPSAREAGDGVPVAPRRSAEAVLREHVVERPPADAKNARCERSVALDAIERLANRFALRAAAAVAEIGRGGMRRVSRFGRRHRGAAGELSLDIGESDRRAICENDQALDEVLQLTDVAWPALTPQSI